MPLEGGGADALPPPDVSGEAEGSAGDAVPVSTEVPDGAEAAGPEGAGAVPAGAGGATAGAGAAGGVTTMTRGALGVFTMTG